MCGQYAPGCNEQTSMNCCVQEQYSYLASDKPYDAVLMLERCGSCEFGSCLLTRWLLVIVPDASPAVASLSMCATLPTCLQIVCHFHLAVKALSVLLYHSGVGATVDDIDQ